jgi:hypothetical protein
MLLEKLKSKLIAFGNLEVCKEGDVFTVLITGEDLINQNKYLQIMGLVSDYASDKYPHVEIMKNDRHFVCIILKKRNK